MVRGFFILQVQHSASFEILQKNPVVAQGKFTFREDSGNQQKQAQDEASSFRIHRIQGLPSIYFALSATIPLLPEWRRIRR